jgi:predicted Zn-dependent protease
MTFEQVYSAANADLKFGWRTGSHSECHTAFDGIGNILGHAKRPPYGIIHFDDAENWITSDSYTLRTNLMSVALHEIGHALGIEHSTIHEAVMWKDYQGKVWPEEDDIKEVAKNTNKTVAEIAEEALKAQQAEANYSEEEETKAAEAVLAESRLEKSEEVPTIDL